MRSIPKGPRASPRTLRKVHGGGRAIDPQLAAQLRACAQQHNVTLFMLLLGAFNVLLHRYTGQGDIRVGLLVLTNLQDGMVYRQTYLPLLNPQEEGAAFALLGLVVFYRASERYFPVQLSVCRPWPVVALMALSFWWLNGVLLRALSWYGEVAWRVDALWDSRLIQTCFALFWMLAALVVMLRATRRRSRREWLCGAVLLGIVIVKLMLVDSAGGGGLARAVAFIGVAILVLIIGYFSPLLPKAGEEK